MLGVYKNELLQETANARLSTIDREDTKKGTTDIKISEKLDDLEKKLAKIAHSDTSRGVEMVTALARLEERLNSTAKEIDSIKDINEASQGKLSAVGEIQKQMLEVSKNEPLQDTVTARLVKLEERLDNVQDSSSDAEIAHASRVEVAHSEIAVLKEENVTLKDSISKMNETLQALANQKSIQENGELTIQMSGHLSLLESVGQLESRISDVESLVGKSQKFHQESVSNLKNLIQNGIEDFEFQLRTLGTSCRILEDRIGQSASNSRSFVSWEFLEVSLNQIRAQIEHMDSEVTNNAANSDFIITVGVFLNRFYRRSNPCRT